MMEINTGLASLHGLFFNDFRMEECPRMDMEFDKNINRYKIYYSCHREGN